jgi:hypothetical protein
MAVYVKAISERQQKAVAELEVRLSGKVVAMPKKSGAHLLSDSLQIATESKALIATNMYPGIHVHLATPLLPAPDRRI